MVVTRFSPEVLNALPPEERARIRISGLDAALLNSGSKHVSWLIWTTLDLDTGKPDHEQGSIFFLDCGRGPFAVTAGHVYEKYRKDSTERLLVGCQLENHAFDLKDRLIDNGLSKADIDIATFRITPEEIGRLGKSVVRGVDGPWPPAPRIDEVVFFAGFPRAERITEEHLSTDVGSRRFSMGLHRGLNMVTSLDGRQITSRIERAELKDLQGTGLPPRGHDLSGMSGGPMLALTYSDGQYGWRLAGVIFEGRLGELVESVVATRAHYILPDGRIQP
jgi:hypothetical protein